MSDPAKAAGAQRSQSLFASAEAAEGIAACRQKRRAPWVPPRPP